jgi:hypothetical protein
MSMLSTLKFRASIFAAVVAFAPISPASHAQNSGMLARVNVPFGFQTDSQHLAAGVYTLELANEHTLVIRGASQSWVVMTSAEDNAQPAERGTALFHKYGDQYFLSKITIAGKSRRLCLAPSKAERQMRIATQKTAPAGVELSLLQGAH